MNLGLFALSCDHFRGLELTECVDLIFAGLLIEVIELRLVVLFTRFFIVLFQLLGNADGLGGGLGARDGALVAPRDYFVIADRQLLQGQLLSVLRCFEFGLLGWLLHERLLGFDLRHLLRLGSPLVQRGGIKLLEPDLVDLGELLGLLLGDLIRLLMRLLINFLFLR